jgi:hypothetical protein
LRLASPEEPIVAEIADTRVTIAGRDDSRFVKRVRPRAGRAKFRIL